MKKEPGKQAREKEQAERRFFNLLRRGTQALQRGEIAKALRLLTRAHRMDKENADATLNLGGAYILSKKFAQAVAVLEPLSERESHNPMVWTKTDASLA